MLETIRPDEPDYAPAGLLDRIIGVYDALSEAESENNAELVKELRNVLSDLIELARTMIRGPRS